MLHEVAIMMMLITRGESEPDTGSVLELDDDAQGSRTPFKQGVVR